MFHCFDISLTYQHFSTAFHNFCLMFWGVFAAFLKIIAPGVGFWHDLSAPEVGVSYFLCERGWGIRPFQKIPRGDGQAWN